MQVSAVGDGGKGKKGSKKGNGKGKGKKTRARTALGAKARIATTIGSLASKQQSSKAIALTVRSGVTSAQSAEHGWLKEVQEPEEDGEGVKSAQWSDAENIGMAQKSTDVRTTVWQKRRWTS